MKLDKGQYYGDSHYARDIDGIILTISNYSGRTSLPLHYHKNPYFCFVLNGSYTEQFFKENLNCSKGDVVFHPSQTEHRNQFADMDGSCFNIEFSESWTDKIICSNLNLTQIDRSSEFNVRWIASRIFNEFKQYNSLSHLMIEGLVTELLVTFSRDKQFHTSVPFYLRKIVSYINEQYFNSPSLTELANLAQVSPEHLVREFKKAFHVTIGDYIRVVRIRKACDMLRNTNKEIAEIAFETGFTDQSHLTRVFRKITGSTPLCYRKAQ